jgi:hypothetical protein
MPKKRYTPEEIIQDLRTVELETGKGLGVLDACRTLGIAEHKCAFNCSMESCSTR